MVCSVALFVNQKLIETIGWTDMTHARLAGCYGAVIVAAVANEMRLMIVRLEI